MSEEDDLRAEIDTMILMILYANGEPPTDCAIMMAKTLRECNKTANISKLLEVKRELAQCIGSS